MPICACARGGSGSSGGTITALMPVHGGAGSGAAAAEAEGAAAEEEGEGLLWRLLSHVLAVLFLLGALWHVAHWLALSVLPALLTSAHYAALCPASPIIGPVTSLMV